MLRFLHAADFHLDSPFRSLAPEQAVARRRESRELLERLRACKSHIYGTPVDGAVTVQLKRDRLAVHGYRSDVEFPVS